MKFEDSYIAKLQGGVFFDPFSVTSKEHWGNLCEKVRPTVRNCLLNLGYHEKIDIKVADDGFQYEYTIDSIKRIVSVTRDGVAFDFGRFRVADGPNLDIAEVAESVIKEIQRVDWIEIGCMIHFAIPAKNAEETRIGAKVLQHFLFRSQDDSVESVLNGTDILAVDLSIYGNLNKGRFTWNAYNKKEDQHIIVSLDMKMNRHDMKDTSVSGFVKMLFNTFIERCKPFLNELISSKEFEPYLDTEYLARGVR